MTKTQHHELQMATQTLDTISQQITGKRPADYISLADTAQECIQAMINYADKNPAEIFDHPYWSDQLSKHVQEKELDKTVNYSWFSYSDNGGEFTLGLEQPGSGRDTIYYPYYKEESDVEEDIKELLKAGYLIAEK